MSEPKPGDYPHDEEVGDSGTKGFDPKAFFKARMEREAPGPTLLYLGVRNLLVSKLQAQKADEIRSVVQDGFQIEQGDEPKPSPCNLPSLGSNGVEVAWVTLDASTATELGFGDSAEHLGSEISVLIDLFADGEPYIIPADTDLPEQWSDDMNQYTLRLGPEAPPVVFHTRVRGEDEKEKHSHVLSDPDECVSILANIKQAIDNYF